MRMGTAQVQKLFRLSGLHYSGYQPMTPADFETLMTALTTLANEDFYAAAIAYLQIDETAIPNPRSRPAPQEISTEAASLEPEKLGHAARRSKEWASVRNSRGDVIQHDDATSFLLLRNLPINVSVQELLPLLRKYADCPYLDTSDIVLPSTVRTPRAKLMEIGAHAYVNFRHIRDARKAKAALNGRDFGGRPIEIDYSIGKPTNKVWIGGVPAGLTPAMLAEYMSKFGQMSESIDIKGRGRGDAFAFAVFNSVDDAARAVKALSEANNTIEGHVVRIGYNSTKSEFDDKDRDQARDQDHRDREMDRTRPRDYPREQGQERYRERDREQESRSHSWDAPPYRVDYSRTDPRRAFMGGREDEYPRDRQGYGNYPDEREYIDDRPMRAPIDSAVERDYRGGEGKRRYDAHSYHYPDRAPALYERRDSRDDNSWGAPVPSRQYDESYAQRPQHNEYPVRAPQGYSTASVQAQYAPYDEPYGKSGAQYRDAPRPPPPDYSAHNAPYDNKRSRYNDYTAPHPPLPPSRGSSGGHSLMQPTSRSYAPPPPPSRPRPHY